MSDESSENWIMHHLIVLQTMNRNCVCFGSKKERSSMGTLGHKFIKKNTSAHRNEIFFFYFPSRLWELNWNILYPSPACCVCCGPSRGNGWRKERVWGCLAFPHPPWLNSRCQIAAVTFNLLFIKFKFNSCDVCSSPAAVRLSLVRWNNSAF